MNISILVPGINLNLLKMQKGQLIELAAKPERTKEESDALEGIIALLDSMGDIADGIKWRS